MPKIEVQILPLDVFTISTEIQHSTEEPSAVEEILRLRAVFEEATVFPVLSIFVPGNLSL